MHKHNLPSIYLQHPLQHHLQPPLQHPLQHPLPPRPFAKADTAHHEGFFSGSASVNDAFRSVATPAAMISTSSEKGLGQPVHIGLPSHSEQLGKTADKLDTPGGPSGKGDENILDPADVETIEPIVRGQSLPRSAKSSPTPLSNESSGGGHLLHSGAPLGSEGYASHQGGYFVILLQHYLRQLTDILAQLKDYLPLQHPTQ